MPDRASGSHRPHVFLPRPADRPFRGWQKNEKDYAFSRLLCRARYYPGTPRGVTRMWFNMYGTTPGSYQGSKERPDGLAKNPRSGYQAMFRSGSHQSATRGWLKPTWMTDSLVRKELFGLKQPSIADIAAGLVAMFGLEDLHSPAPQLAEGFPRRGVAVHLLVHRRGDEIGFVEIVG